MNGLYKLDSILSLSYYIMAKALEEKKKGAGIMVGFYLFLPLQKP